MDAIELLLVALAAWYGAYVLTKSSGPFSVFVRIRERFPLGGLTTCIVCAAVWFALLFAFLLQYAGEAGRFLTFTVAAAGAALMLGSYTGAEHR